MSPTISVYLDQLLNALGGARTPVRPSGLRQLYEQKDYLSMVRWVQQSMHLDLQVSLRIAEIGGKERPPMWIETPNAMPPYGTAAFRRTRVWIYIRRDILNGKPFEWLVAGIAHELSHVVLFSIGHPLQHNEKAVDLTAMILGYQNFVVNAERTGIRGGGLGVLASLVLLPF
jgi:hypothetical protein